MLQCFAVKVIHRYNFKVLAKCDGLTLADCWILTWQLSQSFSSTGQGPDRGHIYLFQHRVLHNLQCAYLLRHGSPWAAGESVLGPRGPPSFFLLSPWCLQVYFISILFSC